MPSFDPAKTIRSPSMSAKLSQLKGVSAVEKALLVRVGNLMDTLIFAQRAENNPGQVKARTISSRVPVPTGVTSVGIVGGIDVSWDAVDLSDLSFYELQFDSSATFDVNPTTLQVLTTSTTIKQRFTGEVFVRVRTVTKRGFVSLYTNTTGLTVSESLFEVDQDFDDFENCTPVKPKPRLFGAAQEAVESDQVFTGVGGAIGPSPKLFEDVAWFGDTDVRNQINYTLLDNNVPLEDRGHDLPDNFLEEKVDGFYTYDEGFYMRMTTHTGSFTDFFTVAALLADPAVVDVELLRYINRTSDDFYLFSHFQSGFVQNATMSTVKF